MKVRGENECTGRSAVPVARRDGDALVTDDMMRGSGCVERDGGSVGTVGALQIVERGADGA